MGGIGSKRRQQADRLEADRARGLRRQFDTRLAHARCILKEDDVEKPALRRHRQPDHVIEAYARIGLSVGMTPASDVVARRHQEGAELHLPHGALPAISANASAGVAAWAIEPRSELRSTLGRPRGERMTLSGPATEKCAPR